MSFTSYEFLIFFLCVVVLYWLVRERRWQNIILLIVSYTFYGWIHPWYAIMLGISTLADFGISHGVAQSRRKNLLLAISLFLNLGVLFFFKYNSFFIDDIVNFLLALNIQPGSIRAELILPAGLSFYTLKKIGYIIDVSRGALKPTKDLIAFGVFVAFFPQITAGPIDRPQKLLPQIESPRIWQSGNFAAAWHLLVMGLFKKFVIANSVAPITDQIFHLQNPTLLLAITGALGFTLLILADFSAYTDISRGISYLLGFDTSENFKSPYFSLTPTEFWNRWHITLSFWLRDYVFFPLRRATLRLQKQLPGWLVQAIPPLVTMLVSGIWHGAGWTFVIWGGMYGILIVVYQALGIGGNWRPASKIKTFFAWLIMFSFIVFGWMIFAAPSLGWILRVFANPVLGSMEEQAVALLGFSVTFIYTLPLIAKKLMDRYIKQDSPVHSFYYAIATLTLLVYINSSSPDFIYFRF
jgi:alginate O-acetyltransferase complex protein AlgI